MVTQYQFSYQLTASVARVPSRHQWAASGGGQLDNMVEDLGDIMVNRAVRVNWVQLCSRLHVQMHLASTAAAGPRQTPLKLARSSESLAAALR